MNFSGACRPVRARAVARVAAALAVTILGACASTARTRPNPDLVRLTLVGTADLHGWLAPHEVEHAGDAPMGGVATFGGYLDILRAERPGHVVLVDAGDLFQGTVVANLTEGAAVVRAYNALGYDAAAVGNHEFDYGPEGESTIAHNAAEDPLGALKARMREAKFPFLAGNIVVKGTNRPVDWAAKSLAIVHRAGVTIGVIGLITPTTPEVTLAANVAGLTFKPLLAATESLAAEARAHGAQVVVLAVHAGGACPPGNKPHDLTGCDGGEIFPLLEALPRGTVDAVVAGHTHEVIHNFVNGVPVIESKAYGEAFGVIDLVFNRDTGKIDPTKTDIWPAVPICVLVHKDTDACGKASGKGPLVPPTFLGRPVVADAAVAQAIAPDLDRVKELQAEPLGPTFEEPFGRSRTNESALGDLVADLARGVIPGAEIGFVNSGGLRADIERGPVTYGGVFDALPFDNHLATLRLTGAQVVALIDRGLTGDHGILQMSGVRVEAVDPSVVPCAPGGSRVLSAALEDGTPIDPGQLYTVVTNDFVASGGDGYGAVLREVPRDRIHIRYDLPPLRDEIVAWLRFHPELKGPPRQDQPRLTYVKPDCAAAGAASP